MNDDLTDLLIEILKEYSGNPVVMVEVDWLQRKVEEIKDVTREL